MKYMYMTCLFLMLCQVESLAQHKKKLVNQKINLIYKKWNKEFNGKLLDQHLAGILPSDKDFRLLSENCMKHKEEIYAILGNKKEKDAIKYIALATLQYQCFDTYKKDLKKIIELFKNKSLSEKIFMLAIWQDSFSLEVIRNINTENDLKMSIADMLHKSIFEKSHEATLRRVLSLEFYNEYKADLRVLGEIPFECK